VAPKPDVEHALSFLRNAVPGGPWLLVAIDPERKAAPSARTFDGAVWAADSLREWLRVQNEHQRNVYWSVNPTRAPMDKKPTKNDVAAVRFLHVDVDHRAGEDFVPEHERILALLTTKLPPGLPPPSIVVDSGGGFQAFWRLAEPVPLAGPEAVDTMERYNRRLATLLGGDHCHNVDRVMRLPGTVNWPDARKRKKGRTPKLAKIAPAATDYSRAYALSEFKAEPRPVAVAPAPVGGTARTTDVQIPDAVERVGDLDALPLSDRCKVIAVHGRDPDSKKSGDDSRSAWLFDFVCNALRDGCTDAQVFAVITDRDYGVSASVLDKGRRARDYALKQIRDAREELAGEKADFQRNDKNVVLPTQANIRLALHKLGVQVRHNVFADRLYCSGMGLGPELGDAEMESLLLEAEERFALHVGKERWFMVVAKTARANGFHPVRDYLDSLTWDETPRVDAWLSRYLGADDSEYTRAVGRIVLVAACRRVRQPGCKFDEMMVLESAQGLGKSTALQALCPQPEWFSDDLPLNAESKVVIERLQGRWIVEAAELKGMRRGDVEHLKSLLSRQEDRARLAYGRFPSSVPRQCVIVGTTNSDKYLRDATGNRRFWPVRVGRVELRQLRADRDQLWAEAAHHEALGASIRLAPELWALAGVEQEERAVEDPFAAHLADVLGDMAGKIRARDVWTIVGVSVDRRTQEDNERLGTAMRRLGWERVRARFGGPSPEIAYVRGTKRERERRIAVSGVAESARASYDEQLPAQQEVF
jgi:hypothetical protein